MNYKVMQRPMFRLGGTARKNYEDGTTLAEIKKLIGETGDARSAAFQTARRILPFQALSGQMENIRGIRSLGDITDILSNLGSSPELFGALGKLSSIDLKEKEGALKDKLAVLKAEQAGKRKKFEFERRLNRANQLKNELSNYITEQKGLGKSDDEIRNSSRFKDLNRDIDYLLRETSLKSYLYQRSAKEGEDFDIKQATKDYYAIGDLQQEFKASGGRVGYQQGTPDPMVMPQPKPQEAVQDRQLDTLMDAAPALEDPNQAKSMGETDMYAALRRRLPKEISDDVVRLIAYNQEAFADFANISDQSDVESFNQKYNVELVLPVGNQ